MDVASIDGSATATTAAQATQATQNPLPVVGGIAYPSPGPDPNAPQAPGAAASANGRATTLEDAVRKIYNTPHSNLQVSFQVQHDPNEIVTVFTDQVTGEVIAQFPPEIMVKLAEFFNRVVGAVFDKQV